MNELERLKTDLSVLAIDHARLRRERDEARAEVKRLKGTVRSAAQTIHEAYHPESKGTFYECPRNVCMVATDALPGEK